MSEIRETKKGMNSACFILFCSLHPTILFWLSQIIGITGETNGMLRD